MWPSLHPAHPPTLVQACQVCSQSRGTARAEITDHKGQRLPAQLASRHRFGSQSWISSRQLGPSKTQARSQPQHPHSLSPHPAGTHPSVCCSSLLHFPWITDTHPISGTATGPLLSPGPHLCSQRAQDPGYTRFTPKLPHTQTPSRLDFIPATLTGSHPACRGHSQGI